MPAIQSGVPSTSIRDYWLHNLGKFPNKTAVIYEDSSWTFAECDALIENVRRYMVREWGLERGDTVAMAMR